MDGRRNFQRAREGEAKLVLCIAGVLHQCSRICQASSDLAAAPFSTPPIHLVPFITHGMVGFCTALVTVFRLSSSSLPFPFFSCLCLAYPASLLTPTIPFPCPAVGMRTGSPDCHHHMLVETTGESLALFPLCPLYLPLGACPLVTWSCLSTPSWAKQSRTRDPFLLAVFFACVRSFSGQPQRAKLHFFGSPPHFFGRIQHFFRQRTALFRQKSAVAQRALFSSSCLSWRLIQLFPGFAAIFCPCSLGLSSLKNERPRCTKKRPEKACTY